MGLRITLPCPNTERYGELYAALDCEAIGLGLIAVRLQERGIGSGQYKRCPNKPFKFYRDAKLIDEAKLVDMFIEAENLHDIPRRSHCAVRVDSLRLWDYPEHLVSVDWVTYNYG